MQGGYSVTRYRHTAQVNPQQPPVEPLNRAGTPPCQFGILLFAARDAVDLNLYIECRENVKQPTIIAYQLQRTRSTSPRGPI